MRIPNGSTDRYVYFVAVDVTDLKTRETGLTGFAVRYSLNGGVSAAMTTPTVNQTDATNMPGVYELLIDESAMTTLAAGHDSEELCLHITHASMAPVTRVLEISRPETTEGKSLTVEADGMGHADVKEWLGVAATRSATSLLPEVDAKSISDSATAADNVQANIVNLNTTVSSRSTFDPAVTAVVVGDIVTAALARFFTLNSGSTYAASVAGSVVKEIADNGAAGSETTLRTGTAQAGGASTITLDAGASAVNDHYKHSVLAITGGTGAEQAQIIDSYVGATKVATMAAAWAVVPDATSVFVILPLGTIPGATAPTVSAISTQVLTDLATQKVTVDRSTGDIVAYAADDVTPLGTRRITEITANLQGLVNQP